MIIALVLAALGIVLRLLLPGIMRSTIESRASARLGLPVEIDRLELSLSGGRLSLHGISVGAHEDIGGRDALTIGRLSVDLRLASLMNQQIDVEEFLLHDVDFLALREDGGARNIGPFLEKREASKEKKPRPSASTKPSTEASASRPPREQPQRPEPRDGDLWTVRIRHAEIRNIAAKVRSEGEPSRQTGEATATLGEVIVTNMEWPSSGGAGTIAVKDFRFDGIDGRWEGTQILGLESAAVTAKVLPNELIIEDATFDQFLYRQSWDHLTRDQIKRTESLIDLVFSADDSDYIEEEDIEEEAEDEPLAVVAEVEEQPDTIVEEVASVATSDEGADNATKRDRRRPAREFQIRRLKVNDASWIHQTRIDGIWIDVVTSFEVDVTRDGTVTNTIVRGRSSYEDSSFEVQYSVDEEDNRLIVINAQRMPFHQYFWSESIKDERNPRVEHVLYDLGVNVTHEDGALLGDGIARFTEVRVTPDRRPFWQRISLEGGGWATILAELADPETQASESIPFKIERPLLEFNFFVLYTELRAAFDIARLAMLDPASDASE